MQIWRWTDAYDIRAVNLTTFFKQIDNPNEYFLSEILNMDKQYNVLDSGKSSVNDIEIQWAYVKNKNMYSLLNYIFEDNLYMINLSTSSKDAFEDRLSQLRCYFDTLNSGN